MTCADSVIIPVVPDHYTIQGLNRFFETLGTVQELTNPNIIPLGILLVKYDERTNLSKSIGKSLPRIAKNNWNTKVFDTKIHHSIAIQYSQAEHTSIIDYDAENPVSLDYANFTKEIIREVENG